MKSRYILLFCAIIIACLVFYIYKSDDGGSLWDKFLLYFLLASIYDFACSGLIPLVVVLLIIATLIASIVFIIYHCSS